MKSEVQFSINAASAPRNVDDTLAKFAARKLGIKAEDINGYEIISKSIDSRKKTPLLVYRLAVELPESFAGKFPLYEKHRREPDIPSGVWKQNDSPIIIGTGPAGLFAALYLAMAGAKPLILDRGLPVPERISEHEKFLATRELNTESNLLIGEGGAGTFSDGKLYTGTKSPFARMVIEEFIRCGAPEEIGYLSRPHVGSDKLKQAIPVLRKRIEELGGIFRFQSHVTGLVIKDGICRGVELDGKEHLTTSCGVLLACGLGGRELIRKIISSGAGYEIKSFQLGCRIEHPQEFIDLRQYSMPRPEALDAAEYHIVSRPANAAGVSSFCMCPGGKVVNASAWKKRCITNGMSDFARDGRFANSCLIATLDFSGRAAADDIYNMMENIESGLFLRGGENYAFPCQSARDFLARKASAGKFVHGCETGIVPGRIDDLIPGDIYRALNAAVKHFDRLMPGFIENGKFIGVESCVSSPVRLLRDENGENTVKRLFPAGEGPGLAGGIISAACDGMKAAEKLLKVVNI